ncbi:MAG: LysM peptidoglycan-binding domain-containing protein, partial [Gammaproteobacteria bacterium]|nr:LysM peptidoglycan-binding domain-containing protein [Gammaproteobacteria bacterium]
DSLPTEQPNAPADDSQPSSGESTESQAGPREYVVQPGDTLGGIATSVTVPIETLMALNGITDPDQIQVGQVLKVPNPSRRSQGPTRPDTYTVAQGDTLAAIAERFDVDVDQLTRINGIGDPDSIIVGLVLRIP